MELELFKPSKKVLEMICLDEKELLRTYEIIPFGTYHQMMESYPLVERGLFSKIISFYNEEGLALNEESKRRLDYQGIHNVTGELFKNWADHSQENSNIFAGFFFGKKGICYGFKEEFFKNEYIKNKLENKIPFEEFDKNPRERCAHSGFNKHIFPCSDFIEVDSEKGVLYCVQFKESIIAPEGKHGSEYCYELRKNKRIISE